MKRRNIILILVLLGVGAVYLISTLVVNINSFAENPELVYYDSIAKINITGTWNISDPHCFYLYEELQDEPIIPREVIRRCFIKDINNNITG